MRHTNASGMVARRGSVRLIDRLLGDAVRPVRLGERGQRAVELLESRTLLSVGPAGPEFKLNNLETAEQSTSIVMDSAAIGDRVWEDLDGDGVQDDGEPGLFGVNVQLYDADGLVATTTTTCGGYYRFDKRMPADSYYLKFDLLHNFAFSPQDQGAHDALDSDVIPATGTTPPFMVWPALADLTHDAGMIRLPVGDAAGFLWEDLDADEVREPGESGLANWTVYIDADRDGTLDEGETWAKTSAAGYYKFEDLPAGEHCVAVVVQRPWVATSPASGWRVVLVVPRGQASSDFGLRVPPATLGGVAWKDVDYDGTRDAEEPALKGVEVRLCLSTGSVVDKATTGSNGHYRFESVRPLREYYLEFVPPKGMLFTLQDQGNDEMLDSDADITTGRTPLFVPLPGQVDLTQDAGLLWSSFIWGSVYNDLDADSSRDANEPVLQGWTVFIDANANGTLDASEQSATTGPDGQYVLRDLRPGTYRIAQAPKPGWALTRPASGTYTIEVKPDSIFELTFGCQNVGVLPYPIGPEIHVHGSSAYSDFDPTIAMNASGNYVAVWQAYFQEDHDTCGIYARLYNAAGEPLTDDFIVTYLADDNAHNPVVAMAPDGSFVVAWQESYHVFARRYNHFGQPLNDDGFQVGGGSSAVQMHPSIAMSDTGAFVIAWQGAAGDEDTVENTYDIYVQRFDADGEALSNELRVNTRTELDQSNPSVAIGPSGDFVVTWQDQDRINGWSDNYNIYAWFYGSDSPTDPFLVYQGFGASLINPVASMDVNGGFVIAWQRGSGTPENTADIFAHRFNAIAEPVGKLLYVAAAEADNETNPSVAVDPSGAFVITWQARIGNSDSASDVFARCYDPAGLPRGGSFVVKSVNDAWQVNPGVAADKDGNFVVLWQSGRPGDEDAPFGYWQILAQRYWLVAEPSAVTGFVWKDANGNGIQEDGEPALEGITVKLLNAAGQVLTSTTTVGGGVYHLANLQPGAYSLQFVNPPGLLFTLQNRGFNDDLDSDADTITGRTGLFELAPGKTESTIDAGLINECVISGAVYYDVGKQPLQSWIVYLDANTNNTLDVGERFAATAVNGGYRFDALHPGTYTVAEVLQDRWTLGSPSTYTHHLTLAVNQTVSGLDFVNHTGIPIIPAERAGEEFRVNVETQQNEQVGTIATDGDGNFVITYTSRRDYSYPQYGLYAIFYNADGSRRKTAYYGYGGDIAMHPDGHFVMTYSVWGPGVSEDVYAQRYDANGAAEGPAFRVNSVAEGTQSSARVKMDRAGNFTVFWHDYGAPNNDSRRGDWARRFRPDGTPYGDAYRLANAAGPILNLSSVSMDPSGNYVITYYRSVENPDITMAVQRYNPDGTPNGSEILVPGADYWAAVGTADNGDFVLAWNSLERRDLGVTMYARRYNAAAVPQGDKFIVNTQPTMVPATPVLAVCPDGSFVIAWDGNGIRARRYNAAGLPEGDEFPVNGPGDFHRRNPRLAIDHDGDFVVAWDSRLQDGAEYGVYAQRYALPKPPPVITLQGTPGDDTFVITKGSGTLQIRLNGSTDPTWSVPIDDAAEIRLLGGAGTDTFSLVNLTLGRCRLILDGGTRAERDDGTDRVVLSGLTGQTLLSEPGGSEPGSGRLTVRESEIPNVTRYVVDYAGIERIEVYPEARTTVTIVTPNPDDHLTLLRDQDQRLLISGTSGGVVIASMWIDEELPSLVIDAGSHDAGAGNDLLDIPAGIPDETHFHIITGTGNNSVAVGAGRVVLPPLCGNFTLTAAGSSVVNIYTGTGVTVLSIRDSARVNVKPDTSNVLRLKGLSILDNGTLDLGGCELIVGIAATPPRSSVEQQQALLFQVSDYIAADRITTSGMASPAPMKGLGAAVLDRARLAASAGDYDVASVDDIAVLVRYTWNGDANLDTVVNADDYFLIDSGFISRKAGYGNGDFNCDGVINADDYFLIDSAFIGQTTPTATASAQPTAHALVSQRPRRDKSRGSVLQQLFSTQPVL